jgi:hypothetical protein
VLNPIYGGLYKFKKSQNGKEFETIASFNN